MAHVVVQRIHVLASEGDVARPDDRVGLRVVIRLFGPAHDLDRGIAFGLPLFVRGERVLLQLVEDRTIIGIACVIVGNMAGILECHDRAPAVGCGRLAMRHHQPQHAIGAAFGIAPQLGQDLARILRPVEIIPLAKVERRMRFGQGYLPCLGIERSEELFEFRRHRFPGTLRRERRGEQAENGEQREQLFQHGSPLP